MSRFPEKSCTFEFDIDGSKTDREIASLIKRAIRPKQRKEKRVKKDILFLCQFFYPEHNSSATLPFDTAKYLSFHGFSVDALCGYPKEYSSTKDAPVTIYLPHVCGSQPQARDISLPKLYNGWAMVWRDAPRAARSYESQPADLPLCSVRFVQVERPAWSLESANR